MEVKMNWNYSPRIAPATPPMLHASPIVLLLLLYQHSFHLHVVDCSGQLCYTYY